MEVLTTISRASGAPSARSMVTSFVYHAIALLLLLLLPTQALLKSERPKELEVVFYRAREPVALPARTVALPPGASNAVPPAPGAPARARNPRPNAPPGPDNAGKPEFSPGAGERVTTEAEPQPKVGNVGILAFRDKFASLSRDRVAPRLGSDAQFSAADEVGKPSARSGLTTTQPGGSGGINVAALNRNIGGGGGGGGGGGTGSGGGGGTMPGVGVGKATSTIAGIGGGDRPTAKGGAGASRTDEEIQIVFDRYKSAFYRLYNRELRNNPTLQGKMVLRLTIEPDGSVSMCVLQSTDMNAPDLAAQVVERTKSINFGAKEGVSALTIVYPIDFLPAST